MKKWLCIYIFIFTTSFLFAQSLQDLAKQAGDENEKGNYRRAIELYTDVIAAEPTNGKWYFYRGQDFSMLNDYKSADADYSKAIALTPQYFDAYLSRAILHQTFNEPEKSINDFNQALRYVKDEAMKSFIYNNRGNSKIHRRDLQGAYNDFLRAYSIDNQSVTTLDNLGKVLNQMSRGDEALIFFKKILELDTKNVSAQSDVAYTLLNLNRFAESIAEYDLVLIKNPNSPLALSNRGLAKMNLLDYSGALDDANRSIEMYPQNPYAFRNRGMIHISMNKTTEGCADFKQSLNLGFSKMYDSEVEEFYKHYCSSTKF